MTLFLLLLRGSDQIFRRHGIALTLATGEQQQGGQGEQKNASKTDVHDRAFQVIGISFWAERPQAPKGSLRRCL